MDYKIIILGIIVSAFGFYLFLTKHNNKNHSVFNKLVSYYKQRDDFKVYISYTTNKKWIKVDDIFDNHVLTQGIQIPSKEITSFIVAYNNGEILDHSNIFYPLPDGIHFIEEAPIKDSSRFNVKALDSGKENIIINHDSFKVNQGKKYYRTTLKNISATKIKIVKFASFTKVNSEYVISTVTNSFFTAEEFNEWYNVDKDGWIKPGQSVSDPNNYGNGKESYWVYYFTDENDNEFIAGIPLPN